MIRLIIIRTSAIVMLLLVFVHCFYILFHKGDELTKALASVSCAIANLLVLIVAIQERKMKKQVNSRISK
jgi:hypothetical protein